MADFYTVAQGMLITDQGYGEWDGKFEFQGNGGVSASENGDLVAVGFWGDKPAMKKWAQSLVDYIESEGETT